MPTADLYQPIPTTPRTLSRWGGVWAAGLATALALALFSTESLERKAIAADAPAPVLALVRGMDDLAQRTGLRPLRDAAEQAASFLDRATRYGAPAVILLDEPEAQAAEPEPEVVASPGERWARTQPKPVRRVLLVGASSIQTSVGTELQRTLRAELALDDVSRKGKVSTGLNRTDFFDWYDETQRLIERHKPDVVIGQFGGNDAQHLTEPDGTVHKRGTDGWQAAYQARVHRWGELVRASGATPVLLGMPVMREPGFNGRMRMVDGLTEAGMASSGGIYIPTADLSADAKGSYQVDVRFGGYSGRMRDDDGIHLTRLGGMYLAHHLLPRLSQHLVLQPAAPEPDADSDAEAPPSPATSYPLTIPSEARGPSRALAWVPSDVPAEGLPLWLLLHGAGGSWTSWSDQAHRELADLATEHRVVIVTPDGEPHGWWLDATQAPDHQIATWVEADLLPHLHATLPLDGRRAISGFSMGGHGALTLALAQPGQFAVATSMSGAIDLPFAASREALQRWLGPYDAHPQAWEARSAYHQLLAKPTQAAALNLLLSCGDKDLWFAPNTRLREALTTAGVPHRFETQRGGHTWAVTLEALPNHASHVAGVFWGERPGEPEEAPQVEAEPPEGP